MHQYESKLLELAERDSRLVVMTAETRFNMRNLPKALGPRFIDVGIAEQNLIGIAAGMAQLGKRPVCHALAAFLTMRAFEFIRTDLGYPSLPVVVVGSFTGFVSQANGPTHQAIEDVAIMRVIPNMTVFSPSDIAELRSALDHIGKLTGPMYVRYNEAAPLTIERQPFVWGANEQLVRGDRVAVLSYGLMLTQCVQALGPLSAASIRPSLFNMRFLKPMDTAMLDLVLQTYEHTIVVEDHFATGGLYSIVRERQGELRTQSTLTGITLGDTFFKPALMDDALQHAGFTGEALAKRIAGAVRSDA
jgi:transketolase